MENNKYLTKEEIDEYNNIKNYHYDKIKELEVLINNHNREIRKINNELMKKCNHD